ncbi:MAG: aspartate aminotransferase family protein [Deltaproteobacteria bacterium]|nr:aspartate aminotransferase family protein [Deltaproteobacteria bacterium]
MAETKSSVEPDLLPQIVTPIPGPKSREMAEQLGRVEGQAITALSPPPIFWSRANGSNIWDADGNRYIDLTAAFGVANVGHAHPEIVEAFHLQAQTLLHGFGDVHPSETKLALLRRLVELFPGGQEAHAILGSSGSDAVEIAIKTAMLATGRSGLLAFEGAYHGVSLGVLDVTWRSEFRTPFQERLPQKTEFARFGDLDHVIERAENAKARGSAPGAVLVEPIQGRGGDRIPPRGFMRGLRELCDSEGWLLIADEIYTGFGRTGKLWACDHEEVIPDLLCVGKGLASGVPLSACLGRKSVMRAWPRPGPEAIHTQTFLGHPASCAAALASIDLLEREEGVARSARLGEAAIRKLQQALSTSPHITEVRGRGLLIALQFRDSASAQRVVEQALERGVILLPSGDAGDVISISPPLTIEETIFDHALNQIIESIALLPAEQPR